MMTEEEFSNKYRGKSFVDTFVHNADEMERYLNRSGRVNSSMNRFFALVPNTVIEELVLYTSEQLVADGNEPVGLNVLSVAQAIVSKTLRMSVHPVKCHCVGHHSSQVNYHANNFGTVK